MLGSFSDLAIDLEQVGAFQSLEAEKVVAKVAIVDDCAVQNVLVTHDAVVRLLADHGRGLAGLWINIMVQIASHVGKDLFGFLVQI